MVITAGCVGVLTGECSGTGDLPATVVTRGGLGLRMLAVGRALWDRALVCLPAFRCLAVDGGMRCDCGSKGKASE